MRYPPSSATLTSRIAAFAQRLGLGGSPLRSVFERAASLQLPFRELALPAPSIWWQSGPPLQRLPELPRSALSGPVQEDKAEAHAVLIQLVEREQIQLDAVDLRQIDGLCGNDPSLAPCPSLEEYLSELPQRQVRIISYKDFTKAISLPLPGFSSARPISLLQAQWHGDRLFWSGEQHAEAFANAIVYARRRELEIRLPAELTRYRISPGGLQQLEARYHMLAMPVQTWNDPAFMNLLLDTGMPYARLTLLRLPDAPEFLLLPKSSAPANALGAGLCLAGAADVVAYLKLLGQL